MYKIIVFDMDGTLSESKTSADSEMIKLFEQLTNKYKVAIISGGSFFQINKQIMGNMDKNKSNFDNIYIFSTNGAKMMYFKENEFVEQYSEDFSDEESKLIELALNKATKDLNLTPEKQYGPLSEHRGGQITYAVPGIDCPLDIKKLWDPDSKKRLKIINYIKDDLKDFYVMAAGMSSIDIVRKGMDKSYGIKNITKYLGLEKQEMLFIGDMIFPGGNDYPVFEYGVECRKVESPDGTKKIIRELLSPDSTTH